MKVGISDYGVAILYYRVLFFKIHLFIAPSCLIDSLFCLIHVIDTKIYMLKKWETRLTPRVYPM